MQLFPDRFLTLSLEDCEVLIEHLCYAEDNDELTRIGRVIHSQIHG